MAQASSSAPSPDTLARYTFSWPLTDANPAPRGGTTRGPAVVPDLSESANWRALHASKLTSFERDRRAILALAGEYRVTFDFLEVASYRPDGARDRPYQSWGTERIYVDQDQGTSISLVHILEMREVNKDGSVSEPFVQRHWRQDWQYEPHGLLEFKGQERWQQRPLDAAERKGEWSETIGQVDDSPRYATLGRWEHTASFSTWAGAQAWRPLPVRELSVHRNDYQTLIGSDRITVVSTGWIQEENNLKAVLGEKRQLDLSRPYLAREYGVAHYQRLRDADFAAATRYFKLTQAFWAQVHQAWTTVFKTTAPVTLHAADDLGTTHLTLADYAAELAAGRTPKESAAQTVRAALNAVGAALPAGESKPAAPSDPR